MKIITYKNAIKLKLKNKKVSISHDKKTDTFQLEVVNYDKYANEPVVMHECLRGVIRISGLKMTRETFEAFIYAGVRILETQPDVIR